MISEKDDQKLKENHLNPRQKGHPFVVTLQDFSLTSKRWLHFFQKSLFFSFFFLLLFPSCSSSETKEKKLRLAFHTMPTTLDPAKSADFLTSSLISLLYEGLMRCEQDEKVEPALAERVEISKDGLTYRFFLKKAYWSDGSFITAFDFEKSWKRIVQPQSGTLCAYLTYPILNAELILQGKLPPDQLGVKAENEEIFQVTLERKTPWFLSLTAFPLFFPSPSHAPSFSPDQFISSGPFLLQTYEVNQKILLSKNPSYWNAQAIQLDQIEISIIGDEETALQLFEKKEIDWLGSPFSPIPLDAVAQWERAGRIDQVPMAASTFLAFNLGKEPLDHPLLRQALSLSIDRKKLVQSSLKGQIPATRPLPPLLSSSCKELIVYDKKRAVHCFHEWLKEKNLTVQQLPKLSLYYRTGQMEKLLAQILQKEWEETLGWKIEIEQLDPKIHLERLYQKNYQMAITSWIAQFEDPISLLERYAQKNHSKNFSDWQSLEYQKLLESSYLVKEELRKKLFEEAEEILAQELPFAPLYHFSSATIYQDGVIPGGSTPSGAILFEKFQINERK